VSRSIERSESVQAWARRRRRRNVGDSLGQRVHDILWRPVAAGDNAAARKRIEDLEEVFATLSPDELDSLRQRLKSGDLAPDFEYRLKTEIREAILENFATQAEAQKSRGIARQTSDRATDATATRHRTGSPSVLAVDRPARGAAGEEARAISPRAVAQGAVGRSFDIIEKQVFSRRVGALFVFVTVRGTVEVSVLSEDEGTIRAYLDLTGGGKSMSIDVADALFGFDASISVSNGSYAFGFARQGFGLQLSNSLTSPVSLSFPNVPLIDVPIETVAPRLGLKGRANFVLELMLDVVPDYRRFGNAVRAGGAAFKNVIRRGVGSLASHAVKISRGLGTVFATGRSAINRLVMWKLERFAKNVVLQWVRDTLRIGGKATMSGALRKVAGRSAARTLGAIGPLL
jgi:hypothetical protein